MGVAGHKGKVRIKDGGKKRDSLVIRGEDAGELEPERLPEEMRDLIGLIDGKAGRDVDIWRVVHPPDTQDLGRVHKGNA